MTRDEEIADNAKVADRLRRRLIWLQIMLMVTIEFWLRLLIPKRHRNLARFGTMCEFARNYAAMLDPSNHYVFVKTITDPGEPPEAA